MKSIYGIYNSIVQLENPIINLLFVMVIIWSSGVLFRKIKQPPVLGELLAGVIFGPPCLGIIKPDETLHVLSELGVFFLMFYAGLETNPLDLKRRSVQSLFVAIGGFLVPYFLGFHVCLVLGTTYVQAMFVGVGLSITAIAVSVRVLMDMNLTHFRITPIIIGASIFDDILSLAFFTLIIEMVSQGGQFGMGTLMIIIGKVGAFFGISIVVGMLLYPYIGKYFASREAKGFTFALIVALIFGVMAEISGLHIILGAYMAGLFVREEIVSKELFQKINDRFVSLTYGFLGPIFFVSLSFHVTFTVIDTHLTFLISLLLAAIFGKLIGASLGALMVKMTKEEALVIGIAMNGRGAVELVVASVGLKMGIIDNNLFSILVIVAFITTILPPFILNMLLRRIKLIT
jgi:Kef-type K+ transport system membrane component KefB